MRRQSGASSEDTLQWGLGWMVRWMRGEARQRCISAPSPSIQRAATLPRCTGGDGSCGSGGHPVPQGPPAPPCTRQQGLPQAAVLSSIPRAARTGCPGPRCSRSSACEACPSSARPACARPAQPSPAQPSPGASTQPAAIHPFLHLAQGRQPGAQLPCQLPAGANLTLLVRTWRLAVTWA